MSKVRHTHRDSGGRLNSCCRACDLVADGYAKYGDFPFLGRLEVGALRSEYRKQNRAARLIDSTRVGTPSYRR